MSDNLILERVIHIARKVHRCDDCLLQIDPGQSYVRTRMIHEREPWTYKSHVECDNARCDLHSLWCLGPDEEISLLNDLCTHDYAYMLAEHPVVAARLGITTRKDNRAVA